MVNYLTLLAANSIWERLTPLDRARLGLALVAFVLLFVAVIGFVIFAARMARREIRKPLPPVRDLKDAWAKKPLSPVRDAVGEPEAPPSNETHS